MISVCLPTYNREAYLAECINSVINQTYKDWELIVIDDGSTDSTPRLMEHFLKDKRIKYIKQKNQGISKARNGAVRLSKGEYVAVMDSDDVMHPDRLKKSLKAIKDVDFVYSSYYMGDSNCKVAGITKPPAKVIFQNIKENSAWPHVTIMAKRKCFIENPYRNDFKVNDDGWLVYRWFVAGYKNKMIKEPLVIQRGHTGNTSRSRRKEIAKTQKIMDKEYTRCFLCNDFCGDTC